MKISNRKSKRQDSSLPVCHPVKIMTDQITDEATPYHADNNGSNGPSREVTNAQTKDREKYNEYPGTTFSPGF